MTQGGIGSAGAGGKLQRGGDLGWARRGFLTRLGVGSLGESLEGRTGGARVSVRAQAKEGLQRDGEGSRGLREKLGTREGRAPPRAPLAGLASCGPAEVRQQLRSNSGFPFWERISATTIAWLQRRSPVRGVALRKARPPASTAGTHPGIEGQQEEDAIKHLLLSTSVSLVNTAFHRPHHLVLGQQPQTNYFYSFLCATHLVKCFTLSTPITSYKNV